jgi:hypothetical protein
MLLSQRGKILQNKKEKKKNRAQNSAETVKHNKIHCNVAWPSIKFLLWLIFTWKKFHLPHEANADVLLIFN